MTSLSAGGTPVLGSSKQTAVPLPKTVYRHADDSEVMNEIGGLFCGCFFLFFFTKMNVYLDTWQPLGSLQ